jgi:hypothetical protein
MTTYHMNPCTAYGGLVLDGCARVSRFALVRRRWTPGLHGELSLTIGLHPILFQTLTYLDLAGTVLQRR